MLKNQTPNVELADLYKMQQLFIISSKENGRNSF